MTTRIIIDQSASNTAKLMAQATSGILEAIAEARRVKGIIDASSSGSDYAALAVELGLTGASAATDAQNAWTIFSNAKAAIDVPATAELSRLDQG